MTEQQADTAQQTTEEDLKVLVQQVYDYVREQTEYPHIAAIALAGASGMSIRSATSTYPNMAHVGGVLAACVETLAENAQHGFLDRLHFEEGITEEETDD